MAIAGVLAMEPEILILDEPTCGLDPKGRNKIMKQIQKLHEEKGITIIWVSHYMEQVGRYAKRIVVLNDGKVLFDDEAKNVFAKSKELEEVGLKAPQVSTIMRKLQDAGLDVDASIINIEEAKDSILNAMK